MTTGSGARVTVAGAGALGLCIALELARAGRHVTVCDPAPVGDNASGVAAGMLGLDTAGVADLARAAVRYSFADATAKARLLGEIDAYEAAWRVAG